MKLRLARLLAAGFVLVLPAGALAQTCTRYEAQLKLTTTFPTPGIALDLAKFGDALLIADEDRLLVVDISNPDAPAIVGSVGVGPGLLDFPVLGVASDPPYAYVASSGLSSSDLSVVDLSNPSSPSVVASLDTPGNSANHLAVAGDRVILSDGGSGFAVIDVANPLSPQLVDTFPGGARRVVTDGTLAYGLFTYPPSVAVIDPAGATPSIVGDVDLPYPYDDLVGNDLSLKGSTLFVVSVANSGSPYDGHYLHVVDVSTPSAPSASAPVSLGNIPNNGEARVLADELLWVSGRDPVQSRGLCGYSLGDPSAPELEAFHSGGWLDALLDGTRLFTAAGDLSVYDLTYPTTHLPLGGTPVADMRDVLVQDGYAWVATGAGLSVVDLSELSNPQVVGGSAIDAPHLGYQKIGNLLYAATDGTLTIFDVSDPTTPVAIGSAIVDHGTYSIQGREVAVAGTVAVVIDGTGIYVVDVSDPAAPTLAGTWNVLGGSSVATYAGRIYAVVAGEVEVLDVSNPTHPMRLTSTEVPNADFIRIRGHYAYVTTSHSFFPISYTVVVLDLDVGNPHQHPPIVATVPIDYLAYDMAIAEEFLYLRKPPGLEVWDLTDPVAPAFVAKHESLPFFTGQALVGVDAQALCLPRPGLLNTWLPQCGAHAVTVQQISAPRAEPGLRLQPHPFRPNGTITFAVDRPGPVTLGVFDVAGRLVRRLMDEPLASGTWSVRWSGAGERGEVLPSGVYLVRLETPSATVARKLVLIQ